LIAFITKVSQISVVREKQWVPSAHGHPASNVVGEFDELRSHIDCTTLPFHILQHPFHPTLHLFPSHLLRPFKLLRGEQFGHAQFLHQPPVGAVGGGYKAGAAEGELVGEGEGGAVGEGEVVGLEDVGGGERVEGGVERWG